MILELENLEIGYDLSITKSLNTIFHRGELALLTGKNGSGKTTLLKTLAGILSPQKGRILLNKKELSTFPQEERARLITFASHGKEIDKTLFVKELLLFGRYPYLKQNLKLSSDDKLVIDEEIERFDLKELLQLPIGKLSDGMFKRVLVAKSFITRSPIILLDEPFNFLDYERENFLIERLLELKKEHLIIIASHQVTTLSPHLSNQILL